MDGDVTTDGDPAEGELPEELLWSTHPLLEDRPLKSIVLVAVVVALSGAVAVSFQSVGYGFLSFGLLIAG